MPLPARALPRLLLLLGLAVLGAVAVRAAAPAFDPVAETERYLATLPADQRAKSDAYFEGGYWLPLWELVITAAVALGAIRLGIAQRLRDWATADKTSRRMLFAVVFVVTTLAALFVLKLVVPRQPDWLWTVRVGGSLLAGGWLTFVVLKNRVFSWSRRPRLHAYLAAVWFLVLFSTLTAVVTLPWALWVGYWREHAYGLSNLSLGGWLWEAFEGNLISTVLVSLVGGLLYLGLRRFPRHWWILAAVATPFLGLFLAVLAPVYIAPVFNTYTPLADARIRDPILAMARANGVPADNVYEFDASKQTKRVSANVSGAFGTIRVSLNDNLLNRCSPAEIQAVMGHELGHYVLNHVYKLVIYLCLVVAGGLAFTHGSFGRLQRWAAPHGVGGLDDLASLPLLWLGLSTYLLLATPVLNSIVRSTEAEADIFGLNAARQPDGFATTALKLSEYRKLAPGPWEEIFFFDHPSGYQRILMAMRWKAEHLAELPPPPAAGK